jgi:hypothetical protein
MNDLQVCWWPIEKPIPYARNGRKIPQRAVDKVAASIHEFGWRVDLNSSSVNVRHLSDIAPVMGMIAGKIDSPRLIRGPTSGS